MEESEDSIFGPFLLYSSRGNERIIIFLFSCSTKVRTRLYDICRYEGGRNRRQSEYATSVT